jgi:hypothetical protein
MSSTANDPNTMAHTQDVLNPSKAKAVSNQLPKLTHLSEDEQNLAIRKAVLHNREQLALASRLLGDTRSTFRRGVRLLIQQNLREGFPVLNPFLNMEGNLPDHFEPSEGPLGYVQSVENFLKQQRDRIARRTLPAPMSGPAQCTFLGQEENVQFVYGYKGFFPFEALVNRGTLTTVNRPKVILPTNLGPRRVDNIVYWHCLYAAFKNERANFAKQSAATADVQRAFPDADVQPADDSWQQREIDLLTALQVEINQGQGPTYNSFLGSFTADLEHCMRAKADPSATRLAGKRVWQEYPELVKTCATAGQLFKEHKTQWANATFSTAQDLINNLEDLETRPTEFATYEAQTLSLLPSFKALLRKARRLQ